jgi:hypothetical protein
MPEDLAKLTTTSALSFSERDLNVSITVLVEAVLAGRSRR